MNMGEGGTTTSRLAAMASRAPGNGKVTSLAIMEGKFSKSYGGYGFYFVRKYLADCHDATHTDDPMAGFEESLSGDCIPTVWRETGC